ncbi:benzoate/H(+) symporter BenE family transporter [Geosporobacter ferrireducens]|uniref:Benzoate transporter n=1 Tax=Geosporobacter ferrireducens TaxID=1424294 RepID=A0A1D8GK49_9FIRM|nr:benzoate/H(+) symporter BenE family transporter [Geosporobacter ferrireducens]AOT71279.1 benzoate transporter [Geosporobacter ferrireducens]MTI58093.1 benzoate transporter [Geosporobacter ferrireducens]
MEMAEKKTTSLIESGPGIQSGLKDLRKHLNSKTITTGVVAAIFGVTGPALVTIKAATDAGYTEAQTVSWLFGIYVFGGLISLIMGLYYKMPITGAYSIPGASMLGAALVGFSFNEAAGAFMIAGLLVLLLGLSGLMGKVMKWLPLPIVMGMIGGAMVRFGTNIVNSTVAAPIIGFATLIGFFFIPKAMKKFPPVLGGMILGLITAVVTGQVNFATTEFSFIAPQLVVPSFNVSTILSVSVPLAALVVGAENAQAIGVLFAQGYKTPVNAMTIISGIGGIVSGLFGAHNANIAGPMTAICSSEESGAKEGRYAATVLNGILFASFGLIASIAIAFVTTLPSALINILAGLAMINVLTNAFKEGFGLNKFRMGAFTALVIAMSGITIIHIGSAFWALVGGVVVSLVAERKDFDEQN